MSISRYCYLGPFLACKDTNIEVRENIEACVNKSCFRIGIRRAFGEAKATYCPYCGLPLSVVEEATTRKAINPMSVVEDTKEWLSYAFTDGYVDYYIPNRKILGVDRKMHLGNDDGVAMNFEPTIQQNETTAFVVGFEKHITMVRAMYGSDKVQLNWGLLKYSNS